MSKDGPYEAFTQKTSWHNSGYKQCHVSFIIYLHIRNASFVYMCLIYSQDVFTTGAESFRLNSKIHAACYQVLRNSRCDRIYKRCYHSFTLQLPTTRSPYETLFMLHGEMIKGNVEILPTPTFKHFLFCHCHFILSIMTMCLFYFRRYRTIVDVDERMTLLWPRSCLALNHVIWSSTYCLSPGLWIK